MTARMKVAVPSPEPPLLPRGEILHPFENLTYFTICAISGSNLVFALPFSTTAATAS